MTLKKLYDETVAETTLELATESRAIDQAIKDAKRGFVAHLRGGRKVADMVSQVLSALESGNGVSRSESSEINIQA